MLRQLLHKFCGSMFFMAEKVSTEYNKPVLVVIPQQITCKTIKLEQVMERANEYITYNKRQKYIISYILDEFGKNLMDIHGKCMDVGCGPGDITKDFLLPILGTNVQLIGTDILESMIEYANKTFSDEQRLQFEVLDIQTKNLPKKYISEFDHIFSFHVLHWCNDIQQAFKNIYQMLRPKGTILFSMMAFQDLYDILKILTRDIRFEQYIPDKMKNLSPYQESKNARKELNELLQSIGFEVHHCSLRETSYSEKSGENLNSVISILTFLEDMPQALKEEFKNVLTHEFIRRQVKYKSIHTNEELTLDIAKILVVYAQKI